MPASLRICARIASSPLVLISIPSATGATAGIPILLAFAIACAISGLRDSSSRSLLRTSTIYEPLLVSGIAVDFASTTFCSVGAIVFNFATVPIARPSSSGLRPCISCNFFITSIICMVIVLFCHVLGVYYGWFQQDLYCSVENHLRFCLWLALQQMDNQLFLFSAH